MKSLGTFVYPNLEIVSVNSSTGRVLLRLVDGNRVLKIEMSAHCTRTLASTARKIVHRYRKGVEETLAGAMKLVSDVGEEE